VHIKHIYTGETIATLAHNQAVKCIAVSPQGKSIAVGTEKILRVWCLNDYKSASEKGEAKKYKDLEGHSKHITKVLFTPDGQKIVSLGGDPSIRVWDSNLCKAIKI
jgi:WD40 repeat protein